MAGMNGNSESSSTDEESYKKPKEETISKSAKITRVQVKIGASDSNLVSFKPQNFKWQNGGFSQSKLNLPISLNLNFVGC